MSKIRLYASQPDRVGVRPGTRCQRCGAANWESHVSSVCEACWLDMGQMSLFEDSPTAPEGPWEDDGEPEWERGDR